MTYETVSLFLTPTLTFSSNATTTTIIMFVVLSSLDGHCEVDPVNLMNVEQHQVADKPHQANLLGP